MIIVTSHYGQLGNRLIVFANFVAAAREHGLHIVNPAFYEYADLFEGTCGDWLCRYPVPHLCAAARDGSSPGRVGRHMRWAVRWTAHGVCDTLRPWVRKLRNRTGGLPPGLRTLEIGWERRCDLDSPEFVQLARRPGWLLVRGWQFRALRCFERHAGAIRECFTPAEPYRSVVAERLRRARARTDVLVGVHIRQGDYRRFLDGRLCYETQRYVALMRRVGRLFPGRQVRFLVCSNIPQPHDAFADLPVCTALNAAPVEDLYALAACDWLMGPPSTFSMWASFYGEVPLYFITDPDRTPALADFRVIRDFARAPEECLSDDAPAGAPDDGPRCGAVNPARTAPPLRRSAAIPTAPAPAGLAAEPASHSGPRG